MGKVKVYTKTGDNGTTSLVGGKRVMKTDLRLEAYGSTDELNSWIGLTVCQLPRAEEKELAEHLLNIQHRIFNLGSLLACDDEKLLKSLPTISSDDISHLESFIDKMDSSLPELHQFVLPGGCTAAAHLHVARTVCRRAERLACHLYLENGNKSESADTQLKYLNRLSDFLFMAARYANFLNQHPETLWKK